MPAITVEPELYKRAAEFAQEQQSGIDEVLADALRHYFWEQDRKKITWESERYRAQHAVIKAAFLGRYIAMHKGEVVDHDADFAELWRRIRQRFGRTPVMITRVEETPYHPLTRRGFQTKDKGA